KGEPLSLDDDSMVPPELRMGYRILKNAGYIPPELAERNQALQLCDLVVQCQSGSDEHVDALSKLRQIELRMRLKGLDTRIAISTTEHRTKHSSAALTGCAAPTRGACMRIQSATLNFAIRVFQRPPSRKPILRLFQQ
ncbi:DUF1992 domain-containing protein, partial [Vibrio fluvialis]|nr:DUF1992 domain-containing protein [Vibrio fluvialis]